MKANRGTVWINAGLLLIAAALFLSAYNERESHEARDSARQVIAQLCDALPTEAGDDEAEPTTLPESLPDVQREMPVKTINGRDYIGVLSIPSLELELPVISQWDYPALKVAPCRYSGSLYQDNLIICAHNYASHFGKLKELQPGDTVLFTDMDEHVVTFQVVEREVKPTAPPSPGGGKKLPQTGQLWWPVPVLACAGLGCIAVGLFRRREARDEG